MAQTPRLPAHRKPRKGKHKILWITDPWDTLDHPRDTTLRLMEEAQKAGLAQWWCSVRSIRLEQNRVLLDAHSVLEVPPSRSAQGIRLAEPQSLAPQEFTSIHYRTDPPIDLAYLHPLQLLHLAISGSKKTELINPAPILFGMGEKFEAAALGKLMPPSIVSSEWDRLLFFGKQYGQVVLKPLHQAQSKGIHLLDFTTQRGIQTARTQIHAASQHWTTPILLQRYLKAIHQGETRLWFLDGRLLATVKKLPLSGDFESISTEEMPLAPAQLSPRQKTAASQISKHLKKHRIRLAAVDLIETWVTDFNFSSPGLITLMERTLQRNLAKAIIQHLY